jgi:hypothetical protein
VRDWAWLRDVSELQEATEHQCIGWYCLRSVRGEGSLVCRVGYPKDLAEKLCFCMQERGGELVVEEVRNHERITAVPWVFFDAWRGNVDVQNVTASASVALYVAKYATKAEKEGKLFAETVDALIRRADSESLERGRRSTATGVVWKLLNRMVGGRERTEEETDWMALGLPLKRGPACRTVALDGTRAVRHDRIVAAGRRARWEARREVGVAGPSFEVSGLDDLLERDLAGVAADLGLEAEVPCAAEGEVELGVGWGPNPPAVPVCSFHARGERCGGCGGEGGRRAGEGGPPLPG